MILKAFSKETIFLDKNKRIKKLQSRSILAYEKELTDHLAAAIGDFCRRSSIVTLLRSLNKTYSMLAAVLEAISG